MMLIPSCSELTVLPNMVFTPDDPNQCSCTSFGTQISSSVWCTAKSQKSI